MNQVISIRDKKFELFISADEINRRVKLISERLNEDMKGKNPVFLSILNGAFIFAADLLRNYQSPCEVSFVKLASYDGSKANETVTTLLGLDESLKGRFIVIIDDIIESGKTIATLLDHIKSLQPLEVRIISCFVKTQSIQHKFDVDYSGFEIPQDFVVGYGLDYHGDGRNLKDIYRLVKS